MLVAILNNIFHLLVCSPRTSI